MGALTLPASSLVYVDTQIVIYSVEKHPNYWPFLHPLWAASQAGNIEIMSSELILLETLVGPLKSGDLPLAASYEQLLTSTEIRLIPISAALLRSAAQLRAGFNLKVPDALHAATALAAGCTLFLTNDPAFRRVAGLSCIVLDDVVQAS